MSDVAPPAPTPEEARLLRRARREARRARQREQNVLRAAKMHAARLRFEREQRDAGVTAKDKASARPAIHVGCSGWFYWHWRECFYPPGAPTSRWFEHYAGKFKTVELNAPFYSWPTITTVET